jgi:probable phosphoglycerate mutase
VAERSMPVVDELVTGLGDWGSAGAGGASDRPVVLVAHGGLIAALTAALLDLPVENWPVLGGMGNASWVQLSGHSDDDAAPRDVRWRLDVWNASAQVANDVL